MRILSVGNFGRSWDGSICDEEHIAKALEDLGHTVIRVQREQVSSWNGYEDMKATISDYRGPESDIDFTLIAQWDGYPKVLNLPSPLVYWAFDYQSDGQPWHEQLIKQSDLYLSKPLSDSKYPNWQWLSQDFAPSFLDQNIMEDKEFDVLFTGSYLPWATERIETLRAVDKMFNLTIHSVTPHEWEREGFKDVRGPVMDEGLPELYSRAKINISIDHTITPGYWSDRNAQIMACGGFVLFKYVPTSEMVFRNNIRYFYDVEDCLQQIAFFLEREGLRESIANQGRYFALNNLMVRHRVQDLLTIVEGVL